MDFKGQLSIEFLLIIGFVLSIIILLGPLIADETELLIAYSSAISGINDGISYDGIGIFSKQTFEDYEEDNIFLTHPNSIHIIKVEKNDMGFDTRYNKTKIQFRVYASSNIPSSDKKIVGSRINFYLRKSISTTFKSENISNSLFNPSFSKHYMYTTGDVRWVD